MEYNFKDIHIGHLILQLVNEQKIETDRILKFFKITDEELEKMYQSKNIDTEKLLLWSKLLAYDFFRIYTQHLVLYAPPTSINYKKENNFKSVPQFRKNVYTTEIIDFFLEMLDKGEMTKNEIIEKYNIPKTTLYKWIKKYKKDQ
ncbi:transposase [Flavobacterium sp. CBA20B-1]|uniref:transposase n=1 Tax=unclassified Flavobacterium TaxID=196869 RepID=UPI0022255DE6|nr:MULTISPECIES: transposase [unclassified Flavobacterium]WCM41167.1 transposase [Flavobacterium sp. CBA20B-1]